MSTELEALQPKLKESAKQTSAMLVDIEIQSREAGKTREVVVAEEAVVNAKAIDANKLKVILNVRHTRLSQTAASCLG
jgi:hypothetical protein